MSAKLGNTRKVYIGSSHNWLTGENANSLDITAESVEISDKSSKWAQFLSGKKGATASVTVFADNSDAQQTAVLTGLFKGTDVDVFIGTLGSGSGSGALLEGDAFSAIVTSVSDTNDMGSASSRTISLTANGAVTHYPTISGQDV
ncbi:MAG: hypothetical protein II010_02985 [Oscillospiraceae bacterium]|nr:hypothetical protein [Oscillospiraceae bacterium]